MRAWLIELRGMRSQQEMAWEYGISQGYYASLELGSRSPSVSLAKRMGEHMNFEWTKFYDETKKAGINKFGNNN